MPTSSSQPVSAVAQAESFVSVVLAGNPNCGKTTLFNALTGLRAKIGNYAGVTVERKEGRLAGAPRERPVRVLDLPGTYSLSPQSLDEQIVRDILFQRLDDVPTPALVVIVVDASNLERNLYFATQVIELGYAALVALNMIDVALENGQWVDVEKLSAALGVPVCPIVASKGEGIPALRERILKIVSSGVRFPTDRVFGDLPPAFEREIDTVRACLSQLPPSRSREGRLEALLLLTEEGLCQPSTNGRSEEVQQAVASARERLEAAQVDWRSAAIEARYRTVSTIHAKVTTETAISEETKSDRLDRVLTHKVWGTAILFGVMTLMFQSIFVFARQPMDLLQTAVDWFGRRLSQTIPSGDLNSLLVEGVIAGVGSVVVFLPQILLLFLFIGLLEDTGYMARAAFLMDRLMSRVGLHGKGFIPMLSSFACAIPGIMATRTIESPKDRLVTILIAPLMSCSARLPVYTLLIASCIPDLPVIGPFRLGGLTMVGMYLLGIVIALLMAWIFKQTLLRGEAPMLIMELPPYRRPVLKVVLQQMWERACLFLRRAGTVILGLNILLWFFVSYPRDPASEKEYAEPPLAVPIGGGAGIASASPEKQEAVRLAQAKAAEAGARLRHSYAGRLGHLIEPAIAPLGFDWKIGIGIISSFAAREVFVSTMSTVYNVGEVDGDLASSGGLAQTLQQQKRPDGAPVYSTLVGLSLMVFYVVALQCVSTVAVVRRETNSWKWPLLQWAYLGSLAWLLSFLTYQVGRLLGFG